jgi:hypothetical protein
VLPARRWSGPVLVRDGRGLASWLADPHAAGARIGLEGSTRESANTYREDINIVRVPSWRDFWEAVAADLPEPPEEATAMTWMHVVGAAEDALHPDQTLKSFRAMGVEPSLDWKLLYQMRGREDLAPGPTFPPPSPGRTAILRYAAGLIKARPTPPPPP